MLKLHAALVLEDGERGETDLTRFSIDTGDAQPRKQPACWIPFAVREEVSKQIDEMESNGIIRPSSSAWASPIVLVRKKDGGMRFCVDYRQLNSVTKKNTYPLPQIDDRLDQLGNARFFSTLDLAAGYWQIRMAPEAQDQGVSLQRWPPPGPFVTHPALSTNLSSWVLLVWRNPVCPWEDTPVGAVTVGWIW